MKFTDAQHDAIYTHDKNLVVVAGAGSGKTRVLVERYMALLDSNADWALSALVAITFTKKAAEEMRDRVRQGLEARLHGSGGDPRWATLLSQIDSARIDTIHGLCADILRANAAHARIDPDFEVLDEIEGAALRERVVDAVFVQLPEARPHLIPLILEYGTRSVREVLMQPQLLAEPLAPVEADALLQFWQATWEASLTQAVTAYMRFCEAEGIEHDPPLGDKLSEKWYEFVHHYNSLATAGPDEQHALLKLIDELGPPGNAGSKKNWLPRDVKAVRGRLKSFVQAARDILKYAEPPGLHDEHAAQLVPLWVELINWMREAYIEAKQRRSLLDFDDLERLTRDLLTEHDEVRRRYLANEFKHLLVDEFQDTNQAQWDIVRSLADVATPGTMFVVGDQKQSIYAFRGADVRVFGEVRRVIEANAGREVEMNESFRTHARLMASFNEVFGQLLRVEDDAAAYQVALESPMKSFRQEAPSSAPALDLILIDQYEHDDEGQPIPGADGDLQKLGIDDRRRWEALELAGRIKAMVSDGLTVYDKETGQLREIGYGDFAVLFQALSNVTIYETAFEQAGIPFVTVAGRGYYDRQEVWDLLNLLRAVHNPADNLALAAALRSPLFSLSDDALFALRLQTDVDDNLLPLWAALDQPGDLVPLEELERVEFARECLYELHATAGRVTISELLRDALRRTGYLAVLTGLPYGERRRGNVEKLLEKAQTSGKITLGAFTQYLQDLSAREAREGDAPVDVTGAVQMMSVHASKGLEFPVVILADASWSMRGGARDLVMLDQDKQLVCKVYDEDADKMQPTFAYDHAAQQAKKHEQAERLRLLYVATTRAQDYLIVSGHTQQRKGEETWNASGWLDDLLNVLELKDAITPGLDTHQRAWGEMTVYMPLKIPSAEQREEQTGPTGWERPLPETTIIAPPLTQPVERDRARQIRHIAATQLVYLGGHGYARDANERAYYADRFRRQVLQDAPNHVAPLDRQQSHPRQIGEMVHEALRHWQLPGDKDDAALMAMLRSYAWRQGITTDRALEDAVNQAYMLLLDFTESDMCARINRAEAVYRELPFVYEYENYVIHGVIDVLFRLPGDRWLIVDYKTGAVSADHVRMRRYHLQVGVYAQAVEAQLGITPEVYLHYVRRADSHLHVPENEWRTALKTRLSQRIVEVIGDVKSR